MVKFLLPLIILFLAQNPLSAQCPEPDLPTLQAIQRAGNDQKEAKILAAGYDLRTLYTSRGSTYKRYDKCWDRSAGGKEHFAQSLLWNVTRNTITLATLNESTFQSLRDAIEGRSTSAGAVKGANFYIGKMFRYDFGKLVIDGAGFYTIEIAFKS